MDGFLPLKMPLNVAEPPLEEELAAARLVAGFVETLNELGVGERVGLNVGTNVGWAVGRVVGACVG